MEADVLWTKDQFQLFYSKCAEFGLDPENEGNEVASDEHGMCSFMKKVVVGECNSDDDVSND